MHHRKPDISKCKSFRIQKHLKPSLVERVLHLDVSTLWVIFSSPDEELSSPDCVINGPESERIVPTTVGNFAVRNPYSIMSKCNYSTVTIAL